MRARARAPGWRDAIDSETRGLSANLVLLTVSRSYICNLVLYIFHNRPSPRQSLVQRMCLQMGLFDMIIVAKVEARDSGRENSSCVC